MPFICTGCNRVYTSEDDAMNCCDGEYDELSEEEAEGEE